MEAIVLFSALFLMPVIAFFFMFRFLKHFSKQKEGIALTSFLFALIIWTFSSSILLAGGG
ncbi:TcpD family membrane protein [Lysinibacillus pakistanensis]|uniref:TcpD family membrane protein n=1 Tax=Lysinibacillus pakistanensis TaxID=759811 RepID=UPI003D270B92